MSSTIFYRFFSQKDTSRVPFDGTGITVFDLKREIINMNSLGDGVDFQLKMYQPDTMEEYEDDTTVIPRSSNVIVKRTPAVKLLGGGGGGNSGVGGAPPSVMRNLNATRYVTGNPRFLKPMASTQNKMASTLPQQQQNVAGANTQNMTEEERIASMFATQENVWEQTQKEMSEATPIYNKPSGVGAGGANDPSLSQPPPPGYICYRCGSKDHWIKNCPNNNPLLEGKRIRRTTGIPKKFLKTVTVDPTSMSAEELATTNLMVTQDGKFVVQMEDQRSWEDYQRKQQQQKLTKGENAKWGEGYFEDLPDHLKCPLTHGLIKEAVKTSCCGKVVSKNKMEDLLLDTDFVCPLCGDTDVLLDSLEPDENIRTEVKKFLADHRQFINEKEKLGESQFDDEEEKEEAEGGDADGQSKDGAGASAPGQASATAQEPLAKKQKVMSPPVGMPFLPFPMFPPGFMPMMPPPPPPGSNQK
ncbi:hypothetical protein ACO0QE_001970 [Hanseniaspora vineae]